MYKISVIIVLAIVACVQSDPKLDGYIVGGEIARITDYPHQASLLGWAFSFCGGFIVHERWVATAAHCTPNQNWTDFQIRVGSDYSDREGHVHNVSRVVIHPSYVWSTLDYDVAMVKVVEPFTWTNSVQPIRFTKDDCGFVDERAALRVSGFGETLEQEDNPNVLRSVEVYKIAHEACVEKYAAYPFPVTPSMLCAGVMPEGGRDACQGDSGGALIKDNCAYGIVSWGIGCAVAGYPGVYARISSAATWMEFVIDYL